jgi:hypothetical protein
MSHADIVASQVPAPGELTLDHVAHFVPDVGAASAALERLGFTLTPFSVQSHRLQPEGPLVPAGTANRCVMFERGYIEFLTPTADTPLAEQLKAAIRRYTGVHLIAFGTAAPQADHERLAAAGFGPLPPVALQRPISTQSGEDTARFTVVRVPPGAMAEGRIQFCHQRTPDLVWQSRWIDHANGATALAAVLVCVADPAEAARRYARFTGIDPRQHGDAWALRTARGDVVFGTPAAWERALGIVAPALPWIAGYVLESGDLEKTCEIAGVRQITEAGGIVSLPQALGGVLVFRRPGGELPLVS